jgi:hypothetical protein
VSVLVVGDRDALALAGIEPPAGAPALVVALDDQPFPEGVAPRLRWRREPGDAGGERLIATAGEGLWSRAPWPVRDELFDLPAGPPVALVVGDGAAELERRGLAVTAAERLTAEALVAADVVVHGAGSWLPGDALAVLAAGRVLVTRAEPVFGLVPGLDHLRAEAPEHAADLVQAVLADPAPFAALRAFGRLAAERHRAAGVYARLLGEPA